MESLETREVPASLTAHFANGMNGYGQFSTPAGVDPTQASQTLAVTDLSIHVGIPGNTTGGVALTVQPGATATYSYGVLVGGNATATGVTTVVLNQGVVTAAGYSAPVAYDPADTQLAFQIPDGTGTMASISYTIPWDQVNWTQSSQAIPLTTFNLNIAGNKFTFGSSSYTTSPTLLFSNGNISGLNFAVNTSGAPYLSIAFINGIETVFTGPARSVSAPAPVPQMPAPKQDLALNLTPITTGKAYIIDMNFLNGNQTNNNIATISIEVAATDTVDDIGNKLTAAINQSGLFTATYGGKILDIKPTMNGAGRAWAWLNYQTDTINGVADPTLKGPSVSSAKIVETEGNITP